MHCRSPSVASISPAAPNRSPTRSSATAPGGGVGVLGSQVFNDPLAVLGLPDYNGSTGAVSLGNANLPVPSTAELIVRFTNNSLTTSGTSAADLHLFEVGTDIEPFLLAISIDGISWVDLGSFQGQPASIDIDAFAGVTQGAQYAVRPRARQSGGDLAVQPDLRGGRLRCDRRDLVGATGADVLRPRTHHAAADWHGPARPRGGLPSSLEAMTGPGTPPPSESPGPFHDRS